MGPPERQKCGDMEPLQREQKGQRGEERHDSGEMQLLSFSLYPFIVNYKLLAPHEE